MKHFIPLFLLAFAIPAAAGAACTIEQRIGLSSAGYEKAEIDALCTAAEGDKPAAAAPPAATRTVAERIALLSNGSIVGSGSERLEKRRCYFREGGVLFRDEGFLPFGKIISHAVSKVNEHNREILMTIQLHSGFNTENCLVMRVDKWKYKSDPQGFKDDLAKYRKEYDAILAELSTLPLKGRE